jgi:hypothetical protein
LHWAIALVPLRRASAFALVVAGTLLFKGSLIPRPVRQMRFVMFALGFETIWLSSLLSPSRLLIARIDALVTAFLLRALGQTATQHGNVVENLGPHFSIVIWSYC